MVAMAEEKKKEETQLQKIEKERDEYLEGWRRAEANLINYKKDELKRLEEVAKFGNEDLIKDLLQVLDSLELSLATLEASAPVEKGVYLIKSQLERVLGERGLKLIAVKVGEKFNPTFHEVISEVSCCNPGTIAEELSAGYMLYDKVLRPVRVKIFKER